MSVVLEAVGTMPRASIQLMPEPEEELEGGGDPIISYGEASETKNGEDFTLVDPRCRRVLPDGSESTFAVFGVLDGHNGASAAIFTKQNLVPNVLEALRREPTAASTAAMASSNSNSNSRDEWLASLPKALIAGFEKTDSDFRERGEVSGTTVTLVVVDGWTVTVASVGDSRCILVSEEEGSIHGGGGTRLSISELTVDHRLENNEEERERVTANGGKLGQLIIRGGIPFGPLRCWPGGLSLSRSIGDFDVGDFIIATPDVKQCKIDSRTGASCRLIIASDGVWDAFRSVEKVATCCRGLPANHAARRIVKQSVKRRGLRDDTTCLVIDMFAPRPAHAADTTNHLITAERRRQGSRFLSMRRVLTWTSFQRNRRNESSTSGAAAAELEVRESINDERRWNGSNSPLATTQTSSNWVCATCQKPVDNPLFELTNGISVHAGSFFYGDSGNRRVLCITCEMVEARDGNQRR